MLWTRIGPGRHFVRRATLPWLLVVSIVGGCSRDVTSSRLFGCITKHDCGAGYDCIPAIDSALGGVCMPASSQASDAVCGGRSNCDAATTPNQDASSVEVACDDGDPCTDDSVGQDGWCQFKARDCSDLTDACNLGVCVDGSCLSQFRAEPCTDGDLCTEGDVCEAGKCVGWEMSCDDGDPCTLDACGLGSCQFTALSEGAPCGAKEACFAARCTTEMVVLLAGSFPMGSPVGEGWSQEGPLHVVELMAFAIDRYEVTSSQYAAFLNAHGNVCELDAGVACLDCDVPYPAIDCGASYEVRGDCVASPGGPNIASCADHPAVGITWYGAAAYCAWVGKRLPSEAEWERAANGPGGDIGLQWRRFPWSEPCPVSKPVADWSGESCPTTDSCPVSFEQAREIGCIGAPWTHQSARANCNDGHCDDGFKWGPAPVGTFEAGKSAEGVYDLSGNVWEWTQDWFSEDFYASAEATIQNPLNGAESTDRVTRSGSFQEVGLVMRGATRFGQAPNIASPFLGVRCARSL